MALTRSFPIDEGYPNALDLRRLDAGLIVREGVFPDPTTTATAGVAYGDGGWNVGAVAFVAALKRGGAPYSLSYGVARLANDAAGTAWTIDAAPASGSRIDLLWIRATDPGEGEATSGTDGPGGVARAVPVFGVTTGVAATTPVAPALPAGALLIATVTTPSGAASIAGSTIVQSYKFAQLAGGIRYARTLSEFSDEPGYVGEEAITLTSYQRYRYDGAAWVVAPYRYGGQVRYTASGTFVKADYPGLRALRVRCQGGGASAGTTPATANTTAASGSAGAFAESLLADIPGLAANVAVTVGAGGALDATGGATGNAGGASSFGTLVSAQGGNANLAYSAVNVAEVGGVGDTVIPGGGNGSGSTTLAAGGVAGGSSVMGVGGAGQQSGTNAPGRGFGAGGGGGSTTTATARAGGAGAPGIVIVDLYY